MNPVRLFAIAETVVNRLPESIGRALFDVVGTIAGSLPTGGTLQLRKNQARLRPGLGKIATVRLSARAMRSYMRYYYESFRLNQWDTDEIHRRVNGQGLDAIRAELANGSVAGALMHAGNWDLAGAWSTDALAPVHTIAEKLEPPELFEGFLSFRESLGMTIYPLVKGAGALHGVEKAMREERVFSPLLADRDLSANGIEVRLAGIEMLVAPGPALLAQRLGCGLYPVFISYERLRGKEREKAGTKWRTRVDILPAVHSTTTSESSPQEREADIERMSQEWIDAITPVLLSHLENWHMLQKVFVDDLDPERLARARANAAAKAQASQNLEQTSGSPEPTPGISEPTPGNSEPTSPAPENTSGNSESEA